MTLGLSMLFAEGAQGPLSSILIIVLILVILIAGPLIMSIRNKKEQEKQRQLVENLKVGEYVITYSGVFGKIVEIVEKEMGKFVTIETGEAHKNYITVSTNAIYMMANNNPKVYDEDGNDITPNGKENKKEAKAEDVTEKVEEAEQEKIEAEDSKPQELEAEKKSKKKHK